MTYDSLVLSNGNLKTRVSELEVINELFRGRVAELETSQGEVRREADAAHAREASLKRRVEELEAELAELKGDHHRHKRVRMSDIIDESQTSSSV
jgi:GATA-binding protein, other eukaryote